MKRPLIIFLLIATIFVVMTGCADAMPARENPYGFLSGLLHGLILPFSFIVSLFDGDTVIYSAFNVGGWYDFGFVLGASIVLGGSGNASKRR